MTLVSAPLHVHRVIVGTRIAGALVAIVSWFAPWHIVYAAAWGPAFCWAPDCHPAGAPAPVEALPSTCTGLSHHSLLPLALFCGLVVLSVLALRRVRINVALLLVAAEVAVAVAFSYAMFDLKHMFDRVEVLIGQRVFSHACGVVALTILIDLLATPVLYLWARARLPR